MSKLLIVGFNEKYKADEVLLDIIKEEKAELADLEDAVVVTKNAQGKIRVKPYYDILSATRGEKSEFWGVMILSLLENDNQEALVKIGFNQEICSQIEEMMKPNSSAIFILLKKVDFEQAKTKIEKYQGQLLNITLSHQDEKELLSTLK